MKIETVHEGVKALFDEALAVTIGEIDETGMTMPTELEELIRVSTYEEVGVLSADPGIVLRFKGGAEFHLVLRQVKLGRAQD